MVILEEDTDVEVGIGVGVLKTGKRGGGRGEGVAKWVVRRFSEPWSEVCSCQSQGSRGMKFLMFIPRCIC